MLIFPGAYHIFLSTFSRPFQYKNCLTTLLVIVVGTSATIFALLIHFWIASSLGCF